MKTGREKHCIVKFIDLQNYLDKNLKTLNSLNSEQKSFSNCFMTDGASTDDGIVIGNKFDHFPMKKTLNKLMRTL